MRTCVKLLPLAFALAALPASGALAQTSPVAAGVQIGTPGVGASVQLQASRSLVVRGDVDYLRFDHDGDYSGVDYDGKLKSTTLGAFADLHPGGGGFLVSAGAYLGSRKLDMQASPTSNVDIGGQTFTPAQVGRIRGEGKLSKVQPFVGFGYDNTFTGDHAWGFRALAGVSFSKKPDVELTASGGLLSSDPAFLSRLEQEEADIRDDAKGYRFYPVVQVGITHRF